jgi:HEAT repeat protein
VTDNEAFEFLMSHQPLPDDEDLSKELIGRYDEVRRHFVEFPNQQAVPLLLHSFGNGDGFGVYQLVEDAISGIEPGVVVGHLLDGFESSHASIRYWCVQISGNYNDERLVRPLLRLLNDVSADTRMAALISIEKYADASIAIELSKMRDSEREPAIRELFDEILFKLPD